MVSLFSVKHQFIKNSTTTKTSSSQYNLFIMKIYHNRVYEIILTDMFFNVYRFHNEIIPSRRKKNESKNYLFFLLPGFDWTCRFIVTIDIWISHSVGVCNIGLMCFRRSYVEVPSIVRCARSTLSNFGRTNVFRTVSYFLLCLLLII